jgi:hypothetical protein
MVAFFIGVHCFIGVMVVVMTFWDKICPPCKGCQEASRVAEEGISQGYNTFGYCPIHGKSG